MKRALILSMMVFMAAACTSRRVVYLDEPAPAARPIGPGSCLPAPSPDPDEFFSRDWPRGPDDFACATPRAFPYEPAPAEPPSAAPDARRPLRFLARALRSGDLGEAAAILADLRAELAAGTRSLSPRQRLILAKVEGYLALKDKRYAEAEAASRRAIALGQELDGLRDRRHTAEAHYNLGVSLYYQEQIEESYQELRRYELLVLELGSRISAEDAYHLGVTAYLSGERAEAYAYFAAADPELRARAATVLEDPEIERAGTPEPDDRVKVARSW